MTEVGQDLHEPQGIEPRVEQIHIGRQGLRLAAEDLTDDLAQVVGELLRALLQRGSELRPKGRRTGCRVTGPLCGVGYFACHAEWHAPMALSLERIAGYDDSS